jgi:hypothetical protein
MKSTVSRAVTPFRNVSSHGPLAGQRSPRHAYSLAKLVVPLAFVSVGMAAGLVGCSGDDEPTRTGEGDDRSGDGDRGRGGPARPARGGSGGDEGDDDGASGRGGPGSGGGSGGSGGSGGAGRGGDVGDQCERNEQCSSKACVKSGSSDFGYCTKICQSFADCPSFWQCERVGNASAKYCVQE